MKLTKSDIERILPHRDPFLLIDEIEDLVPRKYAKGIKYVTEHEYWVPGHFPGQPVMPGVILVESLAQVGAVVLLSDPGLKGKIVYLAGIEKAKFRRKVVPGEKLELFLKLTRMRGDTFGYGEAVAKVNGETACELICSFSIG